MKNRRPPFFWIVTLMAWACGSAAQGAVVSIHPILDNTIYSESDTSNALGPLFAGTTRSLGVRRGLMQFDIAGSIPAGATINSVTLDVTQTKIGPGLTATFGLHPLLESWGEGSSVGSGSGGSPTVGDATWNFRFYDATNWTTVGGDFGSTSGTAIFGTANTVYTFSSQPGLVVDVQNWLDTPGTNFGWVLLAEDESAVTARQFGSRESSLEQQPSLTVDYTAVPEPSTLGLLGASVFAAMAYRLGRRRPSNPTSTATR